MGTRSTTKFIEKFEDTKTGKTEERTICAIYQQFDGYPSGVGMQIAEFLKDIDVVNGMSGDRTMGKVANGIGCLSAQYIALNKDEAGNLYMTNPDDSQEYNYEIVVGWEGEGWNQKPTEPIIRVSVYTYDEETEEEGALDFEGTALEFIDLVNSGKVS